MPDHGLRAVNGRDHQRPVLRGRGRRDREQTLGVQALVGAVVQLVRLGGEVGQVDRHGVGLAGVGRLQALVLPTAQYLGLVAVDRHFDPVVQARVPDRLPSQALGAPLGGVLRVEALAQVRQCGAGRGDVDVSGARYQDRGVVSDAASVPALSGAS